MNSLALPFEKIKTDRSLQLRVAAFAADTVDSIVAEGFVPAKFDHLPVIRRGSEFFVAGDGHSRYEALRRLREAGKPIPQRIPCRMVDAADVLTLAYTANMSRTPFTPCEEAAIFKRRLDAGESIDRIADTSGRTASYVRDRLSLCGLAPGLRDGVGKEYGMTVGQAIVFAKRCELHNLDHAAQQALWRDVVSQGDYTPKMLDIALRGLAERATEKSSDGMMFELPANMACSVQELNDLGNGIMALCRALRSAQRYVALVESPILKKALNGVTTAEIARLETMLERKYAMLGQKGRRKQVDRAAITRTGQLDRALQLLNAERGAA